MYPGLALGARREEGQVAHEALEHGQRAFGLVARARCTIQLEEEFAQGGHEQRRQRFVLMGF